MNKWNFILIKYSTIDFVCLCVYVLYVTTNFGECSIRRKQISAVTIIKAIIFSQLDFILGRYA